MRAIVAAFLAPLLVAIVPTQVLAQAAQQQSHKVQTEEATLIVPPDTTALQVSELRLLRVPIVDPGSPAALFWAAGGPGGMLPGDSLPGSPPASIKDSLSGPPPTPISDEGKGWILLGVLIVVVVGLVLTVRHLESVN